MSYNLEQDLDYIDIKLRYYQHILGIDPDNIADLSIDFLLEKAISLASFTAADAREYAISGLGAYPPAILFLRNIRIELITNIRRFWYMQQLALGASSG